MPQEFAPRPKRDAEMQRITDEDAAAAAEAQEAGARAGTENGEKLKAELDELLDEIDGVLEINAEEFVKSYIQKGGQ